ncbi:MAG: hypothetical protein ACRDHL_05540 [Candidatus Promineifilaceae bacterium]
MARAWLPVGVLIWLALAGCQGSAPPAATVVGTIPAPPVLIPEVAPLTLVRNPSAFDGQFVRLTGAYRPLPLLACGQETHLSPATWLITALDVEIPAAGFDTALRTLLAPGALVTVEGRWQYFEGPVGCGRRPPLESFWYLSVVQLINPNPLAPAQGGDDVVAGPPAATSTPGLPATGGVTRPAAPTLPPTPAEPPPPQPFLSPTAMGAGSPPASPSQPPGPYPPPATPSPAGMPAPTETKEPET